MESGRIRVRRETLNPFETVDVEWAFTQDQFAQFKSFFDVDLVNGSLSMNIHVLEDGEVMAFMGSTYNFEHSDGLYLVSAKLEKLLPV